MQESTSIMGVRVERKYVVVDTLIDAVTILCQVSADFIILFFVFF